MSEDAKCSGNCDTCLDDCDGLEGKTTVTLTLDDGEVLECAILTIFPSGDYQYIALLPLDENGENEDGEVFLYRFELVNELPSLSNIESDEEYEAAAEGFNEWMAEQVDAEFDSLLEYEEEYEEESEEN